MEPTATSKPDLPPVGRLRLLSLDARVALVCGTLMAPLVVWKSLPLAARLFIALTDRHDREICAWQERWD